MHEPFRDISAGAWGTAVGLVLAQNEEHRVALWSARPEFAGALHATRENVRLLPGVPIPPSVHLTTDITEAAADADLLIVAIPTLHLRATLARIAKALPPARPALSLVKGIENGTFQRPSEIIAQVTGRVHWQFFPAPVMPKRSRGLPTTLVAASEDLALARSVQQQLSTDRFRVYTNLDMAGVELAGALKNIIGIAAGICDGLGFGDNTKAALLTRGLAEMARFGVALGAETQTFWGLAGMGDLITTCFSRHGRNRAVGQRLAQGEKAAAILGGMDMIAEGVNTTRSVHDRAAKMGISMPITHEVYRVLYEGKEPRAAVDDLMLRAPKQER